MKRDLFSRDEMIEFVRNNLYPVNIIYQKKELDQQKQNNIQDYRDLD